MGGPEIAVRLRAFQVLLLLGLLSLALGLAGSWWVATHPPPASCVNPTWEAQCDAMITIDASPFVVFVTMCFGFALLASGTIALLADWAAGIGITGHRPGG